MTTFILFNLTAFVSTVLMAIFRLEPGWQYAWLPLVYVASYYAVLIVFVFLACFSGLFVSKRKTYSHRSLFYHWIQVRIIECLCMLCLVRVKVTGKAIVPKEGAFYLVGNHQSQFDPMLAYMILKKHRFAFISKPENFKIPLVGRIMHRNLFLPIDRENNRNALLTMTKAIEMLSRNYSVGIYPEGHRNKTDETLLPFHAGSFRVPLKAKVPVLIAVVDGAKEISRRKWLHPVTVRFRFVELVAPERFADTQALSDYCRNRMLETL